MNFGREPVVFFQMRFRLQFFLPDGLMIMITKTKISVQENGLEKWWRDKFPPDLALMHLAEKWWRGKFPPDLALIHVAVSENMGSTDRLRRATDAHAMTVALMGSSTKRAENDLYFVIYIYT